MKKKVAFDEKYIKWALPHSTMFLAQKLMNGQKPVF